MQLQLPFPHLEQTLPKRKDKLREKSLSTNVSVVQRLRERARSVKDFRVEELWRVEHDDLLIALGKEMEEDSDYQQPINTDKVKSVLKQIRLDPNRTEINMFVLYKYDTPIGFMVATCDTTLYNDDVVASQYLWFISKPYRNPITVLKLLDAFERWAKSRSARYVFTGSVNARYSEQISRTVEAFGYPKVGYVNMKELDYGSTSP